MPRDKANTKSGVQFTLQSAKEIADTVRAVRNGNRNQPGVANTRSPYASSHYLSKTSAEWKKDTKQTLTIYVGEPGSEAASTGDTVEAWNKTGDIGSGKWVLLGRANGTFYLAGPELIEQDVLTGVTLSSGGLVFTKETLLIVGKKSPSPSSITVSTTECT